MRPPLREGSGVRLAATALTIEDSRLRHGFHDPPPIYDIATFGRAVVSAVRRSEYRS